MSIEKQLGPSDNIRRTIPIKPLEDNPPAAKIVDFSVTTDSVVATATIVTDDATQRFKVLWGDGDEDVINHQPGSLVSDFPAHNEDPLPEGTYKLYHVYDDFESYESNAFSVVLQVDDVNGSFNFEFRNIIITPRYRVTNYPLSFRMGNWCDPAWEDASEFKIKQVIHDGSGNNVENTWKVDVPQDFNIGPSSSFRLDGSDWSRERTVQDGSVLVALKFWEIDPLFDDFVYFYSWSKPVTNADHYSELWETSETDMGCTIMVSIPKESKLIVPLPTNDRAVFAPEV